MNIGYICLIQIIRYELSKFSCAREAFQNVNSGTFFRLSKPVLEVSASLR